MTIPQIQEVHVAIGERSDAELIKAANLLLGFSETSVRVTDGAKADMVLRQACQAFLDDDNFILGGCMLFPEHLFNPYPKYTVDIVNTYVPANMMLIQGSNSTSKSWLISILAYLEWWRDPAYTEVKMAAVNENHLKSTLMANIRNFHRVAALPILNCIDTDNYIGLKDGLPDMGIRGVLFPQGQESTGRIRGYRPKPIRKVKHPRFGMMSRTRFFGDEGQSWKAGPFKDFGSLQSSLNGPDPVKIVIAYNPDGLDKPVVEHAAPIQGWSMSDFGTLYQWKSKMGWDVIRLDGALSENVIARQIIYPGLQTYEGYLLFIRTGGDTSASYYCKARGWPPMKGAVNIIIQSDVPNNCRGEADFIGEITKWATVDCAYQGEDTTVITTGRYGLASGWTDQNGVQSIYVSHEDQKIRQAKHILQYDQQFEVANSEDPTALGFEIKRICENMGIKPEHVAIDATGVGFGTYSHLKKYWGPVVAIFWGHKATDLNVLSEDQLPASSLYGNIISEMWFTVRRWFEAGVIIISPLIATNPLFRELSTRRYNRVRGSLLQVEGKREYKARGNPSPDRADSFIQAPMLIRLVHPVLPGLHVESANVTTKDDGKKIDSLDLIPSYLAMGNQETTRYLN